MLHWEKLTLSLEFIEGYIDDIISQCYDIENESYHIQSQYPGHQCYGKYVCRYRRNNSTLWYLIYDIDIEENIFVNKIISNHTARS